MWTQCQKQLPFKGMSFCPFIVTLGILFVLRSSTSDNSDISPRIESTALGATSARNSWRDRSPRNSSGTVDAVSVPPWLWLRNLRKHGMVFCVECRALATQSESFQFGSKCSETIPKRADYCFKSVTYKHVLFMRVCSFHID